VSHRSAAATSVTSIVINPDAMGDVIAVELILTGGNSPVN